MFQVIQAHLPAILSWLRDAAGGGTGVFISMEIAKRWNRIPLSAGQTSALRKTAGALSLVAGLLVATADHSVSGDTVQQLLLGAFTFGASWAASHGMHKLTKTVAAASATSGGEEQK